MAGSACVYQKMGTHSPEERTEERRSSLVRAVSKGRSGLCNQDPFRQHHLLDIIYKALKKTLLVCGVSK